MAIMWSSEPELIAKLRSRVALSRTAGAVLGIGDDCAIVRPRGASEDWLYTTDMLIEGTHFRRETHGARDVGWKALARGLSDIAAMGGEARFCLLSLALAVRMGPLVPRHRRVDLVEQVELHVHPLLMCNCHLQWRIS